jgi:hypothetical protein
LHQPRDRGGEKESLGERLPSSSKDGLLYLKKKKWKTKRKRRESLLTAIREREERGREFWAIGSLLASASMKEDAGKEKWESSCKTENKEREREKGETKRVSWREFERIEMCNWRKGLGSLYSELDGPDHSKMIVSNGWDEDSGRFGIKNRILDDSVHEFVSAESRSIYLNSVSIDLFEQ